MKKLLIVFALFFALASLGLAQTGQPHQADPFTAPIPPYPTSFTCGVSGTPGTTTYYYWIVAIHPAGHVANPFPYVVSNAPATLNGSNFVVCNWNNPAPASVSMTFALLRSTTASFPSTGTTAVTASTSSLTANDQSNSLNSYTFTAAAPANALLFFDNQTNSNPTMSLRDGSTNNSLQIIQTASGVNGVKVTTGATGTGPTVSSGVAGSDTNTALNVTSKGTGAINIQTGDGTRTQFQVTNTAGTIVNNVACTGAATGTAPSCGATGSDSTVALNLTTKSTAGFQLNGSTFSDSTGALGGGTAGQNGNVYSAFGSATTSQINSGQTILADVSGRTVKIVGFLMQAIGGAAGTCTAIQVADSAGTVGVSVAIAGLTQNTVVTEATASNVTLTTFLSGLTAGKGLVLQKTGSSCATLTSLNYRVLYTYL